MCLVFQFVCHIFIYLCLNWFGWFDSKMVLWFKKKLWQYWKVTKPLVTKMCAWCFCISIYVVFYICVWTNLVDWTRGWFYEKKCAFLYDSARSRCPDVALCGLQDVKIQLLTRSLTHAWSRCPDVALCGLQDVKIQLLTHSLIHAWSRLTGR